MAAAAAALLLLAAVQGCAGLYEDQAGQRDWAVKNVGGVLHARQQLPKGRLVAVGTDAGVVAAVNVRSGTLAWRRVMPDGETVHGVQVSAFSVFSLSGCVFCSCVFWSVLCHVEAATLAVSSDGSLMCGGAAGTLVSPAPPPPLSFL